MITFGNKPLKPAGPALAPVQASAPASVGGPVLAPAPASVPAAKDGEGAWRVLPLEGTFEFAYLDASGRPSLRRLVATELKVGPGKLLLGGVDVGLQAYRGFRVDRIHRLHAADTGETVDRNVLDWLLGRAASQAREKAAREKAQRAAGSCKRPKKAHSRKAEALAAA